VVSTSKKLLKNRTNMSLHATTTQMMTD